MRAVPIFLSSVSAALSLSAAEVDLSGTWRLTFRPRADERATFEDFKRACETMHLRESYE